jgi:hypothetical protein
MDLFIDAAGTGFWKWNPRTDPDEQPDLLRLATLLCQPNGDGVTDTSVMLAPRHPIDPQAQEFHQIGGDYAMAYGGDLAPAIRDFREDLARATRAIGFSVDHHRKLITRAAERVGVTLKWPPTFCAMRLAAPIVRIGKGKNNQWQWPTMAVAYQYFTGHAWLLPPDSIEAGDYVVSAARDIWLGIQQAGTPAPETIYAA